MLNTITIIGGGVAGLSLGISLRRQGVPVTVHEAGCYPRHRVCGEFLNGLSDTTINELGIESILQDASQNRSTAWFIGDDLSYQADLPEPARGLSRYVMDHALAQRFQELDGTLLTQSQVSLDGEEAIWCTGRLPDKTSPWLGMKCHLSGFSLTADLEMHLGAHAYVGLSRIEEGKVNLCGLFHRQRNSSSASSKINRLLGQLRLHGLHELAERTQKANHDEASFKSVAGFRMGAQSLPPQKVALGDHQHMICPFTGNGMTMALQSAAIASPLLVQVAHSDLSWSAMRRTLKRDLVAAHRGRVHRALLVQPFLFHGRRRRALEFVLRYRLLPLRALWHALC
jgi:2-polyprenyl-6-methoxyphenol hydroxylase-like FAD-dependent oxidoreductase